VKQNTKYIQT